MSRTAAGERRLTLGSPRRPVAAEAGALDGSALDAFPEGGREAPRSPVLAAHQVAEVAAPHLALVLERALEHADLALQPPFVLVAVGRRRARARERRHAVGVALGLRAAPRRAGARAHRSPPRGSLSWAVGPLTGWDSGLSSVAVAPAPPVRAGS